MKDRLNLVWSVTKWEFSRFFKWGDLIKGAFYMLFFGLIGVGVTSWLSADTFEHPVIAVSDYGAFSPGDFEQDDFRFTDQTGLSGNELEELLQSESADALLEIVSIDSAVIQIRGDRAWLLSLRELLSEKRTQRLLREINIDEAYYNSLEAGITLQTIYSRENPASKADKVVAGMSILLVLMAVFMGFAYQFTAITAEKQQRITEQVVSAIEPQTWIDGKILGITGIGLAYVIFYGGLSLLGTVALVTFAEAPFGAILAHINLWIVLLFLTLSFLGILMWNCFFSAVAATINDPNSSGRSGMMLLPMLPVMFAFFTLLNPDSIAIRVLGVFPLTSYAVLPARMVLTRIYLWEIALAFVLLAAVIWFFRRGAGKIFATSMMMYGKEPTVKEIVYWFRKH